MSSFPQRRNVKRSPYITPSRRDTEISTTRPRTEKGQTNGRKEQPKTPGCKPSRPGPTVLVRHPTGRPCITGRHECCDQIFEILKQLPGIDKSLFHKPKIPIKEKIECLCNSIQLKDSMVPIFFHILKRFLDGMNPMDELEVEIFDSFKKISDKGRNALASSLKAYEEMPKDKRECIFKNKFLEWPIDKPIDYKTILHEWILEGLFYATGKVTLTNGSFGGPGEVREWERTMTDIGPKEFALKKKRAPWPWICAVSTGVDSEKWYRNMEHNTPGPDLGTLDSHELDVTCEPTPNIDYQQMNEKDAVTILENCVITQPSADDLAPYCDGGQNYVHPLGCLKIPDAYPGLDITLK
jgi:hypothetical protein